MLVVNVLGAGSWSGERLRMNIISSLNVYDIKTRDTLRIYTSIAVSTKP